METVKVGKEELLLTLDVRAVGGHIPDCVRCCTGWFEK